MLVQGVQCDKGNSNRVRTITSVSMSTTYIAGFLTIEVWATTVHFIRAQGSGTGAEDIELSTCLILPS